MPHWASARSNTTQVANSGPELFTCEFEAPVGEISGIIAYVRDEFEVLFDDSNFGFYTDVNGLVYGQPPAGGPSFYTFTTGEGGGQDLTFISVFPEPFVITESEPLRIAIVVDMIHTMKGQVVGGQASFRNLARPAFIKDETLWYYQRACRCVSKGESGRFSRRGARAGSG